METSDGPETPTEWKSVSRTNQVTGVGARDAYASKNCLLYTGRVTEDKYLWIVDGCKELIAATLTLKKVFFIALQVTVLHSS